MVGTQEQGPYTKKEDPCNSGKGMKERGKLNENNLKQERLGDSRERHTQLSQVEHFRLPTKSQEKVELENHYKLCQPRKGKELVKEVNQYPCDVFRN